MIHYLKIENFGPIKSEVEMNFEVAENTESDTYEVVMPDKRRLLKLAYIYGANASGKTMVLKAFDFLRGLLLRPKTNKGEELDFQPYLFCEDPYSHPSRFEFSFYCNDIRHVYEIKFNRQSILSEELIYYKTAKPTELFTRITDTNKLLSSIQFGSKTKVPAREKDLLESNTLHNNTIIGAFTKTNVDIPELSNLATWADNYMNGLFIAPAGSTLKTTYLVSQNPGINKWVNSFLNKADNQIRGVLAKKPTELPKKLEQYISDGLISEVEVPRKVVFVHNSGENSFELPINMESNGTQRYYWLAGPLYEIIHESKFMCIDELETSLHPDLFQHLLQVFLMNAKKSQMLFTTHNLSLLANQDLIRRDALWFTEKNEDGSVNLYSAADFDSTVLRKDASIINAYRSGKLGAKPNLGSPYVNEE